KLRRPLPGYALSLRRWTGQFRNQCAGAPIIRNIGQSHASCLPWDLAEFARVELPDLAGEDFLHFGIGRRSLTRPPFARLPALGARERKARPNRAAGERRCDEDGIGLFGNLPFPQSAESSHEQHRQSIKLLDWYRFWTRGPIAVFCGAGKLAFEASLRFGRA